MLFRLHHIFARKNHAQSLVMWLATLALLVQIFLPLAAACALPVNKTMPAGSSICLSGSRMAQNEADQRSDKAKKNICPVCHALTFFDAGLLSPPAALVIARADIQFTAHAVPDTVVLRRNIPNAAQPRGPPVLI